MAFITINPYSEAIIAEYLTLDLSQVEMLIHQASERYSQWSRYTPEQRARQLKPVLSLLLQKKLELAALITLEMGKPMAQAVAEIEKCHRLTEFYLQHGPAMLSARTIKTESKESMICFEPLGILLAIMPWNYPFWQVFRMAIPNLIVGNTVVVKHAPNTTGCQLAIEQLFLECLSESVYSALLVEVETVGAIIAHPSVRGVTLTGSAAAGRSVAALAGQALKKIVLELGGSDPYLILANNDKAAVLAAAKICVTTRMANAGQVCISPKRIIIHKQHYSLFKEEVLRLMQDYRLGDPMNETSQMGPLARRDLQKQLELQVNALIEAGAQCHLGGKINDGQGFFYPPTLLTDIPDDSPVSQEELFGPVMCLYAADTDEEAITIANQSPYGLSGAVFCQDLSCAKTIAQQDLQLGTCAINGAVQSDPRLPFGGVKQSGFGRELGEMGLHEFCNVKTVVVR